MIQLIAYILYMLVRFCQIFFCKEALVNEVCADGREKIIDYLRARNESVFP